MTTVSEGTTLVTDGFENDSSMSNLAKILMYTEIFGYTICLLTNIFGYTLTLVAMHKFSFLNKVNYFTVKALTIADLANSSYICISLMMTFELIDTDNHVLMTATIPVMGVTMFSAILHVFLVAIDRFIAVIFPYFYAATITKTKLISASACVWVLSVLLSLLYMYLYQLMTYWSNLADIIVFLTTFILLTITHGKIACVVRSKRNQVAQIEVHTVTDSEINPQKIDRATLMMLVIVGVFLILWFPVILGSFMIVLTSKETTTSSYLRRFGGVTILLKSSVNFIIYALVNSKVRYAYKLLLTCKKQDTDDFSFQATSKIV